MQIFEESLFFKLRTTSLDLFSERWQSTLFQIFYSWPEQAVLSAFFKYAYNCSPKNSLPVCWLLSMPELLTKAFCIKKKKKRLEKDLCWIVPHVPSPFPRRPNRSGDWTELMNWSEHVDHLYLLAFLLLQWTWCVHNTSRRCRQPTVRIWVAMMSCDGMLTITPIEGLRDDLLAPPSVVTFSQAFYLNRRVLYYVDGWNSRWVESDTSVQMNVICFIFLKLMSSTNMLRYLFWRFCVESASFSLPCYVCWSNMAATPRLFRAENNFWRCD